MHHCAVFSPPGTIAQQDPATGKSRDHEVLTSVLRDAWEKIIVRDVATAGGVEARQVRTGVGTGHIGDRP